MGGAPGTQKQVVEPWSGAKPYFTDLYKRANDVFNSAPTKYEGSIYAGPNQTQRDALAGIKNLVPDYTSMGQGMRSGVDPVRALGNDTISGRYMHADSNPYLKGAVDAAQRDTWENFTRRVMPGIRAETQLNGTFGGDRTSLMMGQAMGDAIEAALGQANQIYAGNYNAERDRQMQSPQLFGQANALDAQGMGAITQGQQLLGTTGDQEQSWEQAALDAALAKWNMDQDTQWGPIERFLSILNNGGYNSGSVSSGIPRSASIFQGSVGGGLNGYLLGQQMGMNPQQTALIAAALGGASGF